MVNRIIRLPVVVWVIMGLLASYFLFYITPVFFNHEHKMQFFSSVPLIGPVGGDLFQVRRMVEIGLLEGKLPGITARNGGIVGCWTPLLWLLFAPMLMVEHFLAYKIMTAVTLVSFLFSELLLPILISENRRISPLIILIFAVGLFSYGLQFELERGQRYSLTAALCFLAIYIFHYHARLRYLAYLLFSLSLQLKFTFAIFIFMFMDDAKDWKNNLKRFIWIGLINVGSLFILGWKPALDFITYIVGRIREPMITVINHSASNFLILALKGSDLSGYVSIFEILFFLIFSICFGFVLFTVVKKGMPVFNQYLLLACTAGFLIVPHDSFDYNLPVLAGPFAFFINNLEIKDEKTGSILFQILMVFLLGFGYGITLFSFANKPVIFKNNFPALMLIFLVSLLFLLIQGRNLDIAQEKTSSAIN